MQYNERLYYPPRESIGLWRRPSDFSELRDLCGLDGEILDYSVYEQRMTNGETFGVSIVRNGYMAYEYYSDDGLVTNTYDIYSCTKSLVSLAFGCLMKENKSITLDTPAYEYLPQGMPMTDPRKEDMRIRHLLSMISGLVGVTHGAVGMGMDMDGGPYEYALGQKKSRAGKSCEKLMDNPGNIWDYSDANFVLLSLIFHNITGGDLFDYMKEKVFEPIGLESYYWDIQGGGGNIGPYSNGHSGFHVNARGLARLGYLLLNEGRWEGRQLVPAHWIKQVTQPSQTLNPDYGLGFWVNQSGTSLVGLPKDTYYMKGFRGNRCYVIPSLNMVVTRTATGPGNMEETMMLGGIMRAVVL